MSGIPDDTMQKLFNKAMDESHDETSQRNHENHMVLVKGTAEILRDYLANHGLGGIPGRAGEKGIGDFAKTIYKALSEAHK